MADIIAEGRELATGRHNIFLSGDVLVDINGNPIGDGFFHTPVLTTTTDATPTAVFTVGSAPTDGLLLIKTTILAGNDVDERAVYVRTARVNYDAGVPTLVDQQTDYTSSDNLAWSVTIEENGGVIQIIVTGDASNVTWGGTASFRSINTTPFVPPTPGINQSSFPTQVDVVLGPFWENLLSFSEDDVVTLNRFSINGTEVVYTENGTDVANTITNRIRIRMTATANVTGTNTWYFYAQGAGTGSFYDLSALPNTQGTPSYSYLNRQQATDVAYTFLDLFNNNAQYGSAWPNVFKSLVMT